MRQLDYQVNENESGFIVTTKWVFSAWEKALSVLGVGVFFGVIASFANARFLHLPTWAHYCVGLLAAMIQTPRVVRAQATHTTIMKFEAKAAGTFPHGYQPPAVVPMARIACLVYREEQGRGENETLPSGLWAELYHGSSCLVPGISEDEANSLAERIEARFHHCLGASIPPGRTTGPLTTLGL